MVAIPADWRSRVVEQPSADESHAQAGDAGAVPVATFGLVRGIFWGLTLTAAAAIIGLLLGSAWALLAMLGERWLA